MSSPAATPKHAPLPWRWIVIGTTLAGLLGGLRILVAYRTVGPGVSVSDALVSGLMEWWVWILGAPVAMCLADRFEPFRQGPAGRERVGVLATWTVIAVHAVGALVLSFAHLVLFSALSGVVRHYRFGDRFRVDLYSPLSVLFVPGVLVYLAVVVARWWTSSRRRHLEEAASSRELASRLEEQASSGSPAPIAFHSGRGTLHLRPDEVDWVQAAGNYLELHTGSESHLVRETLRSVHERLGTRRFVRIHRSTIVRNDAVVGVSEGRRPAALLADGTRLPIGASYRARAREGFGLET